MKKMKVILVLNAVLLLAITVLVSYQIGAAQVFKVEPAPIAPIIERDPPVLFNNQAGITIRDKNNQLLGLLFDGDMYPLTGGTQIYRSFLPIEDLVLQFEVGPGQVRLKQSNLPLYRAWYELPDCDGKLFLDSSVLGMHVIKLFQTKTGSYYYRGVDRAPVNQIYQSRRDLSGCINETGTKSLYELDRVTLPFDETRLAYPLKFL